MKMILALGSAGGLFIAARGSFGLFVLLLVAKQVSRDLAIPRKSAICSAVSTADKVSTSARWASVRIVSGRPVMLLPPDSARPSPAHGSCGSGRVSSRWSPSPLMASNGRGVPTSRSRPSPAPSPAPAGTAGPSSG